MTKIEKNVIYGAVILFIDFYIMLIPKEYINAIFGQEIVILSVLLLGVFGLYLFLPYITDLFDRNKPWKR